MVNMILGLLTYLLMIILFTLYDNLGQKQYTSSPKIIFFMLNSTEHEMYHKFIILHKKPCHTLLTVIF